MKLYRLWLRSSPFGAASRTVHPAGVAALFALALAAMPACIGKSGTPYARVGQAPDAGLDLPSGPDVPIVADPCLDNVADGLETDIDCGGPTCAKCANGKKCAAPTDCAGSACTAGLCQAATCSDLVKDGTESDIGCGGAACAPCAQGKQCLAALDCGSGICTAGVCEPGSCTDQE